VTLDPPATRASRRLIHANHADVGTIIEFHHLAHVVGTMGIPTREQVISRFDDPDTTTYLIERDNRIVGFALVIVIEGWLLEIRRLIAAEPGHGDGTFAVASILNRFFETDALHRAYLEVRASNGIARRLYERAHFVLEGTWRDGFRDRDGSFHDLCAYGLLKSEYDDGVAHSAR
jgi:RimJ/RimL family protein N-acetyltransferase